MSAVIEVGGTLTLTLGGEVGLSVDLNPLPMSRLLGFIVCPLCLTIEKHRSHSKMIDSRLRGLGCVITSPSGSG